MAQKFTVPVTIKNLSSAGSDGITVFLDQESFARLKVEAGGRITWGAGAGAGDTNLYRDEANVLKTDDTFKSAGLFVAGTQIDPSAATVGDALVFTGGEGSGAVATVSSVSSGGITGISLTNAGSGYTSAPTISVTSTAGTGAVITCALVGASVTGITIINGGKNYSTAPSFVFTAVSGGSGASATPTLNLGTEATFTVAFTRTFTYTWNIPDIAINDLGRLAAVNIVSTGYTATTPYTFRINGLQYDSRNSFYSDYGNPILSIAQQTNMCSFGSVGSSNYNITLSPQTIRQIQISVDDSLTAKDTGVLVAVNFVIAIEIEEFDPVVTEIGDPYKESASRLKLQY